MQSDALRLWYPTLEKSSLTPPNAVFPLVWTLLYILTGLSMGLVLLADDRRKYKVLLLFAFQLGLDSLWCYLFFICQSTGGALLCLIVADRHDRLLHRLQLAGTENRRPSVHPLYRLDRFPRCT